MENVKLSLQGKILDYKSGSFTTDDGRKVDYSKATIRFGDREFVLSSDVNLADHIGEEMEIEMGITPQSKTQSPKLTVTKVS